MITVKSRRCVSCISFAKNNYVIKCYHKDHGFILLSSFLRCPQSCWWLFRHFEDVRKTKQTKTKKSWLVSGRRVTQKCQQLSPLLHPWRESSSPWWCGVKRNRLRTVFLWCANSLSFGLHRLLVYNKVLNPMPTRSKHKVQKHAIH